MSITTEVDYLKFLDIKNGIRNIYIDRKYKTKANGEAEDIFLASSSLLQVSNKYGYLLFVDSFDGQLYVAEIAPLLKLLKETSADDIVEDTLKVSIDQVKEYVKLIDIPILTKVYPYSVRVTLSLSPDESYVALAIESNLYIYKLVDLLNSAKNNITKIGPNGKFELIDQAVDTIEWNEDSNRLLLTTTERFKLYVCSVNDGNQEMYSDEVITACWKGSDEIYVGKINGDIELINIEDTEKAKIVIYLPEELQEDQYQIYFIKVINNFLFTSYQYDSDGYSLIQSEVYIFDSEGIKVDSFMPMTLPRDIDNTIHTYYINQWNLLFLLSNSGSGVEIYQNTNNSWQTLSLPDTYRAEIGMNLFPTGMGIITCFDESPNENTPPVPIVAVLDTNMNLNLFNFFNENKSAPKFDIIPPTPVPKDTKSNSFITTPKPSLSLGAPSTITTPALFGSNPTTSSSATTMTSLFGTVPTPSPFTAKTSTTTSSLNQPTPQDPTKSIFGTTAPMLSTFGTPQTSTPSIFGSSTTTNPLTLSAFGNSSIVGNPTLGTNKTTSPTSTSSTVPSIFGGATTATTSSGLGSNSIFGNPTLSNNSTTSTTSSVFGNLSATNNNSNKLSPPTAQTTQPSTSPLFSTFGSNSQVTSKPTASTKSPANNKNTQPQQKPKKSTVNKPKYEILMDQFKSTNIYNSNHSLSIQIRNNTVSLESSLKSIQQTLRDQQKHVNEAMNNNFNLKVIDEISDKTDLLKNSVTEISKGLLQLQDQSHLIETKAYQSLAQANESMAYLSNQSNLHDLVLNRRLDHKSAADREKLHISYKNINHEIRNLENYFASLELSHHKPKHNKVISKEQFLDVAYESLHSHEVAHRKLSKTLDELADQITDITQSGNGRDPHRNQLSLYEEQNVEMNFNKLNISSVGKDIDTSGSLNTSNNNYNQITSKLKNRSQSVVKSTNSKLGRYLRMDDIIDPSKSPIKHDISTSEESIDFLGELESSFNAFSSSRFSFGAASRITPVIDPKEEEAADNDEEEQSEEDSYEESSEEEIVNERLTNTRSTKHQRQFSSNAFPPVTNKPVIPTIPSTIQSTTTTPATTAPTTNPLSSITPGGFGLSLFNPSTTVTPNTTSTVPQFGTSLNFGSPFGVTTKTEPTKPSFNSPFDVKPGTEIKSETTPLSFAGFGTKTEIKPGVLDIKPGSESKPSTLVTKPGSESILSVLDIKPGSESKPSALDMKPGPESKPSTLVTKPGSESILSVLDMKPGSESNLSVLDIKPGSESKPSSLDIKPGSESKPSTLDTKPGSESKLSSLDIKPGSEAKLSTLDMKPGSESKLSSLDIKPGSESILSSLDIKPGSEAKLSTLDMKPGSESKPSTLDTKPGSESILSSLDIKPGSESKPSTLDIKPDSESKPSAFDIKTGSESLLSSLDIKPGSEVKKTPVETKSPFGTSTTTEAPKPATTPFSTPSSTTTSAFGSTSSPFGITSPTPSTSSGSVFGSTSTFGATSTPPSPFGGASTTPSTSSGSVFGTTSAPAFGSTSGFGGTSSTPSPFGSSTSVFGGSTQPTSTKPAQSVFGSAFGGDSGKTVFGGGAAPSSTGAFGGATFGSTSTAPASGTVFGGTSTAAPSSTGAFGGATFGSSSTAPASASVFGNTSAFGGATSTTPSTSAFGGASTTPAAPAFGSSSTGSVFGSTSAPAFGSTSAFGGASSTPATSAFGGASSTPGFGGNGTATNPSGTVFGSSSTSAPAFGPTSAFGGASTTPSTSVFGGSSTPATSAFGGSTSAFGGNSSNPSGSVFGSSSAPTFGSTSAFGGTSTTPSTSAFGGAPTTSAFGGASNNGSVFGSTSAPAFGSTSAFGGASTTPSTSAFGGAPTTSAFGGASSNPTGSVFGSTSAPAFGSTSAFGGGSVFGQSSAFGGTPSNPSSSVFGGGNQQQQQSVFGSQPTKVFGSGTGGPVSFGGFGK